MSNDMKNNKKTNENHQRKEFKSDKIKSISKADTSGQYLFSMSMAPKIDESTHWFQMLLAAFFTSVIIMITRMAVYERPMDQFFWSGGNSQLTDFFSYYKMIAVAICAVLALVFILYRIFTQSLFIKRSIFYIPMAVYSLFVLLSYVFSDYQEFSLLGWNDRFEGTLPLLAYMIMLFFIINSVNSEKNVKWIIYPLAVTSTLLAILGVSQALDHDFFQTNIGKKLITPSWFWDQVDNLNFTFQNKEIYQTVYNINYVSFYLTLLIPLFGLLFIRSIMIGKDDPIWRKILWGALFALLVFNLIGSASSGGLMGMAAVVFIAVIVLNKRIVEWRRPIAILLALTVIIAGASYGRWMPELSSAISGVLGRQAIQQEDSDKTDMGHKVDYMETTDDTIIISLEGNEIIFTTYADDPTALMAQDSAGEYVSLVPTDTPPLYSVNDKRFEQMTVQPAQDGEGYYYTVITIDETDWPFRLTEEGPRYLTNMGSLVDLRKVPAVGWENNQSFGSGRGYIWSRTIPMMKETLLIGHGADTYCAYFPHEDYVGKLNSGTFTGNINIVVDKPHNMYFGVVVGTGGISMLALLLLWGIYAIQSMVLYLRTRYDSFITYVGVGIFLGTCGFLISGLVNDSSVSVMPMFYGLLGTGIAINAMLLRQPRTNGNNI